MPLCPNSQLLPIEGGRAEVWVGFGLDNAKAPAVFDDIFTWSEDQYHGQLIVLGEDFCLRHGPATDHYSTDWAYVQPKQCCHTSASNEMLFNPSQVLSPELRAEREAAGKARNDNEGYRYRELPPKSDPNWESSIIPNQKNPSIIANSDLEPDPGSILSLNGQTANDDFGE